MTTSLVKASPSALTSRIAPNAPIREFVALFGTLQTPSEEMIKGRFRARFVGPHLLCAVAPLAVAISGLPGFWGKELAGFGTARNLLSKPDGLRLSLPMELTRAPSLVDGKECAKLRYPSGFPWRWVVDELRVLDENLLLAMTVVDLPVLRKLAFPFLLERQSGV